ncbi:MAG: ATP-dependent helicase C-terminal domain-containing protein [Corynebacterium sp.]|nr:ATP-dependent helicase C-terminal domain-containing protein [Corynebacterium sp.]
MDFRDLPVAAHEAELREAWASGDHMVVVAPPGTGKTTFIPPLVADLQQDLVIVVVPRRIAAMSAARHLWSRGMARSEVGYAVRGAHHKGSRIMFMTPGVVLNRLMADSTLEGVGAVIIDELHERQTQVDLIFAFINELRQLREDLRVVAMSATIDSGEVAAILGARVVEIEAPIHPITVEYSPIPGRLEGNREFYSGVAGVIAEVFGTGSVLVFLPGIREIRMLEELCHSLPTFILHGQVSPDLPTDDSPRVILATSIAESSVTVPGVRTVVDTGLTKQRNGRGLFTVSTSAASAVQRAGRAGRLGPGRVVRCYREQEFQNMAPFTVPEIMRSDLTDAALYLAAWGTPGGQGLEMLSTPPEAKMEAAMVELSALGAVDAEGHITDHGRELSRIPAEPHLAHALVVIGEEARPIVDALADGARGDMDRMNIRTRIAPGTVVATAFPQWIAKNMGEEYQMVSGRRLSLPQPGPEWIAVADWLGNSISTWAKLENPDTIVPITESVQAYAESHKGGYKVKGVRERRMGAIILSSAPAPVEPAQAEAAIKAEMVADLRKGPSHDSPIKAAIRECPEYWRLQFLHKHLGEPWPDVSFEALAENIDLWWTGQDVENLENLSLKSLYPWPEAAQIDELAPLKFLGRYAVDYSGDQPIVRAKLQDLFGHQEKSSICGQPILFELLSPARRPLATTSDLASFFAGPYKQVRAEMRGRYPKHAWPEDPSRCGGVE